MLVDPHLGLEIEISFFASKTRITTLWLGQLETNNNVGAFDKARGHCRGDNPELPV